MTSPVASIVRSQPVALQPATDVAAPSLEAIRHARGDINEIRMLLKGDVKACNSLFKQAVEEGDVISQIQLSHALFGIKRGKDDSKDFSSLSARDLETFSYYPREFALFNSAYDQAMGVKSDCKAHDARGTETFREAASQGYLPALLELKCKEWKQHKSSYGFAVELRPFVGKGDRQLDYHFGYALKNGSQIGSELYYEGMYWMNQSCGIPVKYPREGAAIPVGTLSTGVPPTQGAPIEQKEGTTSDTKRSSSPKTAENSKKEPSETHSSSSSCASAGITGKDESFEDFIKRYTLSENRISAYYRLDGFVHVGGSVVLAPSQAAWKAFVKEKLGNVKVTPAESYSFTYDATEISALLNQHKISLVVDNDHSSLIESLTVYQNDESVGEISAIPAGTLSTGVPPTQGAPDLLPEK